MSGLQSKFVEYKEKFDPNNQIGSDLISAGDQILADVYDAYGERTFDVFEKEMSFNFIIGNYSIIGFIDRVDMYDDYLEIIDYKTGKREVAQKDVHSNLQLGIYALAASLKFPDKKIVASLHYLRSGRIKSHTFSKEDIEEVKKMLVDKINLIMNDTNFNATKNERVCYFCDHAKSGACATGSSRIKRLNRA